MNTFSGSWQDNSELGRIGIKPVGKLLEWILEQLPVMPSWTAQQVKERGFEIECERVVIFSHIDLDINEDSATVRWSPGSVYVNKDGKFVFNEHVSPVFYNEEINPHNEKYCGEAVLRAQDLVLLQRNKEDQYPKGYKDTRYPIDFLTGLKEVFKS